MLAVTKGIRGWEGYGGILIIQQLENSKFSTFLIKQNVQLHNSKSIHWSTYLMHAVAKHEKDKHSHNIIDIKTIIQN